jgi:hypothetical protein
VPASINSIVPSPDPYNRCAGAEDLPFEAPPRPPALEAETEGDARGTQALYECDACRTPDEEYVWVSERWRVRSTRQPTGLPLVLGLECRPHLDLGDLPNLLAAELGVMTVRLERAVRSLPAVAQVHVNRWTDDNHLRLWFLAQPDDRPDLRGPYLAVWDRELPPVPEEQWRDRLALVAAWLGGFGGRAVAEPRPFEWRPLPGRSAAALTEAAGGESHPHGGNPASTGLS